MQNLSMNKMPDLDGGHVVNRSDAGGKKPRIDLIKEKVNQFAARNGRRPRVLVSHIGPGGQRRTLNQIAAIFARWGFDVDIGAISQSPHQTALTAIDNDVHMICLLNDGEHQSQVGNDLIDFLKAHNCEDILVIFSGHPGAIENLRPAYSGRFAPIGFYPVTAESDILSILDKLS